MALAISGARVQLLLNGQVVGYATGVSGNETINQAPVEILGDIDAVEHVAVGRTVTLSADFVRIIDSSLQAQGVWPRGGTDDVLDFPEMDAVIFDRLGDKPIYKAVGVVPETRGWTVARGGLMSKNATFRARRLFDEVDS